MEDIRGVTYLRAVAMRELHGFHSPDGEDHWRQTLGTDCNGIPAWTRPTTEVMSSCVVTTQRIFDYRYFLAGPGGCVYLDNYSEYTDGGRLVIWI